MKIQALLTAILILGLLAGCGGSPSDSGGDGNNDGVDDPPDQTEDTTPPSAPGSVEGTSGGQVVELTWSPNSEDDLDGYNLYRSESNFSDVSGLDPVNGSPLTQTSFKDEDLQNGTTYYYRLTAVDEAGNQSDPSAQVESPRFRIRRTGRSNLVTGLDPGRKDV
ncbi:fibronectin type III domain-containing protein [Halalkalibaculum sp. DA3122]|uniref:fibronectin type III domain-containing protein n=1 Tax=unclassified Halalkalibaculum TaxID=2964617 RepID=UPI003754EC11